MIKFGIPDEMKLTWIRMFSIHVEMLMDIRHDIKLILIDAPFIDVSRDGAVMIASFYASGNQPFILVCTDTEPDEIKESIIHELVHYEQWRDGRNLTERGVAVRVRNIRGML